MLDKNFKDTKQDIDKEVSGGIAGIEKLKG